MQANGTGTGLAAKAMKLTGIAVAIMAAWIVGGVFLTSLEIWRLETFGAFPVRRGDAVPVGIVRGIVWALLTPFIIWVADRLPVRKPRRLRSIMLLLPAIVLLALGREIFGVALRQIAEGMPWDPSEILAAWSLRLDVNVVVIAGIVALLNGLRLQREKRDRERIGAQLEAELARAELAQLRSDLQPHFLFNALNGIIALVHQNPARAEQVLVALSDLLRRTLEIRASSWLTLEEELMFASDYLEIMKMRLDDRLTFRIEADDEILAASVPPLILQPIVENAVKHGAAGHGGHGMILISARVEGEKIRISVIDCGMRPLEAHERAERGLGLSSAKRRLELLYGNAASVALDTDTDRAVASIRLPVHGPAAPRAPRSTESAIHPDRG